MKKTLSLVLCLMLLFGSVTPLSAFAEDDTVYSHEFLLYRIVDGGINICGYVGMEEDEVYIPATIGAYPVSVIETDAFADAPDVRIVFLPDTIMEIQEGAIPTSIGMVRDYNVQEEPAAAPVQVDPVPSIPTDDSQQQQTTTVPASNPTPSADAPAAAPVYAAPASVSNSAQEQDSAPASVSNSAQEQDSAPASVQDLEILMEDGAVEIEDSIDEIDEPAAATLPPSPSPKVTEKPASQDAARATPTPAPSSAAATAEPKESAKPSETPAPTAAPDAEKSPAPAAASAAPTPAAAAASATPAPAVTESTNSSAGLVIGALVVCAAAAFVFIRKKKEKTK